MTTSTQAVSGPSASTAAQPELAPATATDPPVLIGAVLLAVASLGVMANAAVSAALPLIKIAFAGTPHLEKLIGLVITLPSLGIVLTAGLAGWLNDRFGRRPVMVGSLLLYGAAGLAGLIATSLPMLLLTRFLLGIAIGGTMTSAMAMIADRYRGPGMVRFMSTQAVVMSAASMAFLIVGGLLGELGWRHPFVVYAAGFLMVPVVLALLAESRPARAPGGVPDRLDLRPFAIVGLTALLAMIFFYVLPVRLPFRLHELGYTSPATAGLAVAAGTLSMSCAAMFYSRTGAKLPPAMIYATIFACTAVGFLLIGWSTSLTGLVIGAAIAGAGNGWLFPTNNLLIAQRARPDQRGRASGFHTTCIFTGQFLSPLVSGPIVEHWSTAMMFSVTGAVAALAASVFVVVAVRQRA